MAVEPRPRGARPLLALSILCMLAGCDGVARDAQTASDPQSSPAAATPTRIPPAPTESTDAATSADGHVQFLGLNATLPPTWTTAVPRNQMQSARFIAPGRSGQEPAEMTVFTFGAGMGGANDANIARWAGQFMSADGAPVEPSVETIEVNGMSMTIVELAGAYQGMGMPAPAADQLFISAIIDAPIGKVYLRLVGPRETVEMHRDAYRDMLEGLSADVR